MKKTEKLENEQKNNNRVVSTESLVVETNNMVVNSPQINIPGGVMKDKMVPVLVVLVIVGAFVVGLLYGKVSVYEKGVVAGAKTQLTGTADNQAQAQ